MDSPEIAINAIHLAEESENDGLILPTFLPTSTDDLKPMDMDDARGEMLEGQNDVEGVYSGLPEGGKLQVCFLLLHLTGGLTIELCRVIFRKLFEKRVSHSKAVSTILHC